MSSCGLLPLSLTLIAGLVLHHHHGGAQQQTLGISLCDLWVSQGLSSGGLQAKKVAVELIMWGK